MSKGCQVVTNSVHPSGIGGSSSLHLRRMVNTCASLAAMSATASAGVGDWYFSLRTYLLSYDKSTHSLMSSVPFFGATTISAHHSVGCATGVMISCC